MAATGRRDPRWALVGLFLAGLLALGCAADLGINDRTCAGDAGCSGGERCVVVTSVRSATGDCLESSGVAVCRPACTSCPPPSACGCTCE